MRIIAAFLLLHHGLALGQPLVVLDPGHGGMDPGAVGCDLLEKDVVLDVGRRLDGLLRAAGLRSALTRADDRFIELRARAAFANDRGATLFIAMHANSNAGAPATGTETWIAEAASNTSVQLAGRLQHELVTEWALRDRGVKRANFTVLTATAMPAALTEMAFINRCDPDAALLGNANARQGIAEAHARAITAQLGVNPPPPQGNGVLRGVVFEDRGAGLDDPSVRLGGARVVVGATELRSAADTGAWQFELPPGDHRVTASLAGFGDASRQCTVVAGQDTWCSVGLVRMAAPPPPDPEPDAGVPPPDRGVPPERPDAAVLDAEVRPPNEVVDAGPRDVGAPREDTDGTFRDAANRPPSDDWSPPGEQPDGGEVAADPSGAFCAQTPGRPDASGLWLLGLLALRRRRAAVVVALVALATTAQAHVPNVPDGGTEALAATISGDVRLVEARELTAGSWREALIAPTGDQVLLIHRDGRTLALIGTAPGATPRTLLQLDGATREPMWYPDGQGIAVRTPDQSAWAVPLRGFALNGIEERPRVPSPAVRVALEDERVVLEEAGTRYAASPPGDRYLRVVVSPDGRHVAAWGLTTGIHLLRLDDGWHTRLGGGHPRFDAEGRRLVFERTRDEGALLTGGDLFLVDLDAPHPAPVALTATPDRIELAPSLAGDRLVWVTAEGAVWIGRLVPTGGGR